ncbi:hypothetical protein Dtox_2446 [Desulfofarcimen acetoxidans DSM 771]|uniref:Uncharacterized protein n=1 Tax=Desulfofarcimen acetoxidans (strain ATCC 49208 / DSM 771 / KCTC 5769 / VKM B-1644 / 5575) TaxID=485916 RepID=C8W0K0_DESAS|nr:hypothetical protein [Desulfofarcimen acetoxidans]ACV63255.1 hypothetical protein Dtox_2446 [Desulfofarcimen acetoxidans DSM 771]
MLEFFKKGWEITAQNYNFMLKYWYVWQIMIVIFAAVAWIYYKFKNQI